MQHRWYFRTMQRGEMNADPVQNEFFTPESLADGLVREVIQNALDAATEPEPVRVRFAFPDAALEPARAAVYLEGLRSHLVASGAEPVPQSEPMKFLVIEDFGTRGLQGDPLQDDDTVVSNDDRRNDFFFFWRNVGRSSKADTDRGRWGLGKTVLPAASRLYAFFGLTVRSDDHRRLLMGLSVLKVHRFAEERAAPYGYYGNPETGGFVTPIEDQGVLERFAEDFNLTRRDEPGLSLIVPFPILGEIAPHEILASAIQHYFHPVLSGGLIVEVEHEGHVDRIDNRSIDQLASTLRTQNGSAGPEDLAKLFSLVRWSIERAEPVMLREPGLSSPTWSELLADSVEFDELKTRFESGQRIALQVPVRILHKRKAPAMAYFSVFLERSDGQARGQDHYIRQGITLSGIQRVRDRGVRGLLVVDDPALSSLLGDSENPSHTDWQERAQRLKENYTYGATTVRFVRNGLRAIVDALSRPRTVRETDLLREVFSVEIAGPRESGSAGEPKPARGKQPIVVPPGSPDDPIAPPGPRFALSQIRGGFSVTRASHPGSFTGRLQIRAAYRVRRGNSFKRYQEADFDFSRAPISIKGKGAVIKSHFQNRLILGEVSEEFAIHVTGFDEHRDLEVRMTELGEDET